MSRSHHSLPSHLDSDRRRGREATGSGQQKPVVHYPDSLQTPPHFQHWDSAPASRSSSPVSSDDGNKDSDYDWSGEEDLLDEEAKFEQAMGLRKGPTAWGPKRLFGLLFSSLVGSTILSALVVIPAILVHFVWYKSNPTDRRRYVRDNVDAWLFWAASNLSLSWFLALLVDIVPVIASYVIIVAWGHVSEEIKNKIEMYNSVKDNIKPVFYAAGIWVSWVILFQGIFELYDPVDESASRASYTPRLSQAVEFLFFWVLVWCAQRMLSHAIAFSFHRTAFRERLDTLRRALSVIEVLRLYRPKRDPGHRLSGFGRTTPSLSIPFGLAEKDGSRTRQATPLRSRSVTPERLQEIFSGAHGDCEDNDTALACKGRKEKSRSSTAGLQSQFDPVQDSLPPIVPHPHSPSTLIDSPARNGTNTPTRRPDVEEQDNLVHQAAKVLKSAVLHDARNIQGRADDTLEGLVWNVTSSHEAKRLARSIYLSFKNRRRTYLIPSDFYPAFKTQQDAKDAFRVLDKDDNGDISRAEIKTTIMRVYKERRFLSQSMRDIGAALNTLDNILLFFAMVSLFFISLSVFRVSMGNSLASIYSLAIAASFIFKSTASGAFDAIMFLFVTHPFDTGDRCFIDSENLVVKKIGLFATIFTRFDGSETYYSNSMLFSKLITNVRRSGKTAENLTMQVAWRTPLEKLDALEKCLNGWLATEENRWFEPTTSITLQNISHQQYLEITIGIGHNGNWQDWALRNTRKTAFHAAVNYFCMQLGIVAHKLPMPVAYVDPDTPGNMLFSSTPSDEGAGVPNLDPSIGAVPTPQIPGDSKMTWLGFAPPIDSPIPGTLRARKSKSRKVMLKSLGANA